MTRLSITAISNERPNAAQRGRCDLFDSMSDAVLRRPCTIIIALLAVIISIGEFGETLPTSLQLTRQSLLDGRLWTILSGPLLHVSVQHLAFDVLGLLIVGWIFEPMLKRGMIFFVIPINVAVAIAAFAIYPDLQSYCGLSALDQGLLAAGAVALAMNRNTRPALIIASVLVLKWISELVFAQSSLGLISADPARYGTPVPWCHAIGGIAGALSAWLWVKSCEVISRRARAAQATRVGRG